MTSELPYLKEIAGYLKVIAGGNAKNSQDDKLASIASAISNASMTQNNVTMQGDTLVVANIEEVNDTLRDGMIVTEGEGSSAVEKSVFSIMKEAFVQVFREAMFTTVGQGSSAHEESIFKAMKDEMVAAIHDSLTVVVGSGSAAQEKSLAQLISEQNAVLDGIKTAEEGIEAALAGTGSSGGISAQLSNIETAIGNVETTVSSLGGDIADIKNEISASGTGSSRLYNVLDVKLGEISDGVYSGPTSNALSKLNDIQADTANIRSQVNSIEAETDAIKNEISYTGVGNSRLYNILDVRLENIDINTRHS